MANNYFDAGEFFKAEGMRFEGLARPGVANVTLSDGTQAEFDLAGMLASEGHKKMEIEYNSPETALQNSTPVGVIDRLKLSFGNAKGGVEYLKKHYDNATVGADGQLLVKKGGVWSAVDPDGISDSDGWSFNEIMRDVADLAGEVVLGAGQLIGAGAGAAAGGIGAVPGAAAGAFVASNVNAAMGRILGTYEATPEEYVKGVAMDTLLAAAGERIAIGASNTVVPAIKSMWSKVGKAGDAATDHMVTLARVGLGMDEEAARVAFKETQAFTRTYDEIVDKASRPLRSLLGGEMQGVAPGSFNAMKLVADNETALTLLPLLQNAQTQASRQYTQGVGRAMREAASNLDPNATGVVKDSIDQLMSGMGSLFKVNNVGKGVARAQGLGANSPIVPTTRSVKELMAAFPGLDEPSAKALKKASDAIIPHARTWMSNKAPKGQAAVRQLADLNRVVRDLQGAFPRNLTSSGGIDAMEAAVGAFSNKVTSGLPASLKNQLQMVNQQYAKHAGVLSQIRGLMNAPGSSWENAALQVAKRYGGKAAGNAEDQLFFDTLSQLNPGKGAAFDRIRQIHGAKAWGTTADQGLWNRGAKALVGPAVRTANRALRSAPVQGLRRMAYQASKPASYMMTEAAKMMRAQPSALINDPDKLGAAITMALQGMQQ